MLSIAFFSGLSKEKIVVLLTSYYKHKWDFDYNCWIFCTLNFPTFLKRNHPFFFVRKQLDCVAFAVTKLGTPEYMNMAVLKKQATEFDKPIGHLLSISNRNARHSINYKQPLKKLATVLSTPGGKLFLFISPQFGKAIKIESALIF